MEAGLALIFAIIFGIFGQWLGWRIRLPAIIPLILMGFLAGPVFGLLNPQEAFGDSYRFLIEVAVGILLFEGGLNLKLYEFREAGSGVKRLITVGLILNLVIASIFAVIIGQFSIPIALLIGTLFVITGPTVIMPALRAAKLHRRPSTYLKWEGIINDPIGAIFAIVIFEYLIISQQQKPLGEFFLYITGAIVLAVALSILAAIWIKMSIQRRWIPDYLQVPAVLGVVLLLVIATNAAQEGGGLLAATVLGMILGNIQLAPIQELRRFKESLTLLLLSTVFIILAASLELKSLTELPMSSFIFIIVLLFISRPIAIFLSTFGSEMTWKERLIVGWFAPRGIVVALTAGAIGPRLVEAGYADAALILPLVFTVIFVSVVLCGSTLSPLAQMLGLSSKTENGIVIVGAFPWAIELGKCLKKLEVPVLISDTAQHRIRRAASAKLDTHLGAILNDLDEGQPDLTKYRYVFAATENDPYNAMLCHRVAQEVGHKNVYQLPIHTEGAKSVPADLRGEVLQDQRLIFDSLMEFYFQDWVFSAFPITEDFLKNEDWQQKLESQEMIPFMILHKNKRLSFWKSPQFKAPEPGDYLIAYHKGSYELA